MADDNVVSAALNPGRETGYVEACDKTTGRKFDTALVYAPKRPKVYTLRQ